jgi:replicative DNA helicase
MTTPQDAIPPSNAAIEQAILGCILLDPVRVLSWCRSAGVNTSWFYAPDAEQVYRVIESMSGQPDTIGLLTVGDKLPADGRFYLDGCIDAAPSVELAPAHIAVLRTHFLRRSLMRLGHVLTADAERGDLQPDLIAAKVAGDIMRLSSTGAGVRARPSEVYANILDAWSGGIQRGLPSRWRGLDELIGGYRNGKVYVIAARPGCGKSTFMANEALTWARAGTPVSIASLEMGEPELRGRMLCEDGDLSSFRMDIGDGRNEVDGLRTLAAEHAALSLRINDSGMTVEQFAAWATGEVLQHGARAICLDYLQILNSSGRHESRNTEVSAWCNIVRDCAKRLSVPFLVLSQLSRDAARDDLPPALHHLRDSGSIEQSAYAVCFIHHGEQVSEFIVAKNRGGPGGSVPVDFQRNRQRFIQHIEDGGGGP